MAQPAVDLVSPEPTPQVPRYGFLDTWADAFTVPTFLQALQSLVAARRPALVVHHNVHGLTLMQDDWRLRTLLGQADHCFIDGMPVVWLANRLGARFRPENRIAVLDWIWPAMALAEREGWSVVHLGVAGEVGDRARDEILRRHPDLAVTFVDGHFDMGDKAANGRIVAAVTAAKPTLLLVGMGMPRQEHWLHAHRDTLPPCVVITVGGIMGFLGGDRPAAPRWTGRLGVEWLFRLATEPRRLGHRYLVEPFRLLPALRAELRAERRGARSR